MFGTFRLTTKSATRRPKATTPEWLWAAGRSPRRVCIFLTFSFVVFLCLIIFFVIFVSSVVDTSPQETQNGQKEKM
jgi:hypothetical protein